MPEKEDSSDELRRYRAHLEILVSWAEADEFRRLFRKAGTPEDVQQMMDALERRKASWDWNQGSWNRAKIVGGWLLGLGLFATAVNALRVVYDWVNLYIGQ